MLNQSPTERTYPGSTIFALKAAVSPSSRSKRRDSSSQQATEKLNPEERPR